jgi:hypothetical protein
MDATGLLVKLVYYAIVLFTLQLAINVFGPNPVSELLTRITAFLPRVFVALVLVVVTAAIATAVRSLIESALGGLSYGATVAKVAAGFILALGIIAALNQVGIATTVTMPVLIAVLATAAGILIVGVGGDWYGPCSRAGRDGCRSPNSKAVPYVRSEGVSRASTHERTRRPVSLASE